MRLAEQTSPASNGLLANLGGRNNRRLRNRFEVVSLLRGQVLCKPGETIRHVYFPNDSIISLQTSSVGSKPLKVAMVGREGLFGVGLSLGVGTSSFHVMVQSAGSALRMTAARFRAELKLSLALRRNVHRYAYMLMIQLAQNASCVRIHAVEARLARWVLMTQDRVLSKEMQLTQEYLAGMVGVRRIGITAAASSLRNRNLIDYSRGTITVLDREKLAAIACGCYQIIRGSG